MKWIRRLFVAALLVGILVILALGAGYKLVHGTPQWYSRLAKDPEATRQAADRATQRLIDASTQTARLQSTSGIRRRPPSTRHAPASPSPSNCNSTCRKMKSTPFLRVGSSRNTGVSITPNFFTIRSSFSATITFFWPPPLPNWMQSSALRSSLR